MKNTKYLSPLLKKMCGIMLFAALFALSAAVATAEGGKDYTALAKEKSFESIFPRASQSYYFAGLEEAYDFINTAKARFTLSTGKERGKGLSAKLGGPPVTGQKPVTVTYFFEAFDWNKKDFSIDLTKINQPLEKVLKDATGALLVFMVFYGDRAVSLPTYYVSRGWQFSNNSQYDSFNYNNKKYDATYPVGWSIEKAFSYLKKEIN